MTCRPSADRAPAGDVAQKYHEGPKLSVPENAQKNDSNHYWVNPGLLSDIGHIEPLHHAMFLQSIPKAEPLPAHRSLENVQTAIQHYLPAIKGVWANAVEAMLRNQLHKEVCSQRPNWPWHR